MNNGEILRVEFFKILIFKKKKFILDKKNFLFKKRWIIKIE